MFSENLRRDGNTFSEFLHRFGTPPTRHDKVTLNSPMVVWGYCKGILRNKRHMFGRIRPARVAAATRTKSLVSSLWKVTIATTSRQLVVTRGAFITKEAAFLPFTAVACSLYLNLYRKVTPLRFLEGSRAKVRLQFRTVVRVSESSAPPSTPAAIPVLSAHCAM